MLDTDFVIHAGIGVKRVIQKNWGFRLDLRALFPPSTEGKGLTVEAAGLLGFYADFEPPEPVPAKAAAKP